MTISVQEGYALANQASKGATRALEKLLRILMTGPVDATAHVKAIRTRDIAMTLDLSNETEVIIQRWTASSRLAPAHYERVAAQPSGHDMWFQDKTGAFFELEVFEPNPLMAGALARGAGFDTAAMQRIANYCVPKGRAMHIVEGIYRTNAAIAATGRLSVYGRGGNGDEGLGYINEFATPHTPTTFAGMQGSIIIPGDHDVFQITTNKSVDLRNFEIRYVSRPSVGTAAIRLGGTLLESGVNIGSRIEDVHVQGCDQGFILTDLYDAAIKYCSIRAAWSRCMLWHNPTFRNYSDSIITGCTFWADVSSVFFYEHLKITAGGGLKISNSKFNYGGHLPNDICAIRIKPNLVGFQYVEPMLIDHCSIEGITRGIIFDGSDNISALISAVTITSSQIWVRWQSVDIRPHPMASQPLVRALTVDGCSLGWAHSTGVDDRSITGIVRLEGCDDVNVTANHFFSSSSTAARMYSKGSMVTGSRCAGNTYAPGFVQFDGTTPPSLPASGGTITNNTLNDQTVFLNGNFTKITLNGNVVYNQVSGLLGPRSFVFPANHTLVLEYTGTANVDAFWDWQAADY